MKNYKWKIEQTELYNKIPKDSGMAVLETSRNRGEVNIKRSGKKINLSRSLGYSLHLVF
jgi:hypothetical protein